MAAAGGQPIWLEVDGGVKVTILCGIVAAGAIRVAGAAPSSVSARRRRRLPRRDGALRDAAQQFKADLCSFP